MWFPYFGDSISKLHTPPRLRTTWRKKNQQKQLCRIDRVTHPSPKDNVLLSSVFCVLSLQLQTWCFRYIQNIKNVTLLRTVSLEVYLILFQSVNFNIASSNWANRPVRFMKYSFLSKLPNCRVIFDVARMKLTTTYSSLLYHVGFLIFLRF